MIDPTTDRNLDRARQLWATWIGDQTEQEFLLAGDHADDPRAAAEDYVRELADEDRDPSDIPSDLADAIELCLRAEIGRIRQSAEEADIDALPTAVEWMGDLGYHTGNDRDWAHPICHEEILADAIREHSDDDDVLDALTAADVISDNDGIPREDALDLIGYARRGLAAGDEIERECRLAVAAARDGRWTDARRHLSEASGAEWAWGDDPMTQDYAAALGINLRA